MCYDLSEVIWKVVLANLGVLISTDVNIDVVDSK